MVGIRILGPLEIEGLAGIARVDSYRQRAALGLLALNANRLTSVEAMIDAVWDGRPPTTARAQIQICVSALRRVLTDSRCPAGIETRSPGYRLLIERADLDSERFEDLVTLARAQESDGDPTAAMVTLRRALPLWRGPLLADTPSGHIQRIAHRFTERRVAAQLSVLRIGLELGRDREIIPELREHIDAYPLREEAYGYLMLALHRCGRSAEALEVYQQARGALIQQVGLEPSAQLRELEQAILGGGARLARPAWFEPVRQAG